MSDCLHERIWLDTPQLTSFKNPVLSYHCEKCEANILINWSTGSRTVIETKDKDNANNR